jgi:hypothetical protein
LSRTQVVEPPGSLNLVHMRLAGPMGRLGRGPLVTLDLNCQFRSAHRLLAVLGCSRLHSAPLGSIRLHSAPLGSIRLHSAPFGSIRLHRLRSAPPAPLGSTRLRSTRLRSILLRSNWLRSAPLKPTYQLTPALGLANPWSKCCVAAQRGVF